MGMEKLDLFEKATIQKIVRAYSNIKHAQICKFKNPKLKLTIREIDGFR